MRQVQYGSVSKVHITRDELKEIFMAYKKKMADRGGVCMWEKPKDMLYSNGNVTEIFLNIGGVTIMHGYIELEVEV